MVVRCARLCNHSWRHRTAIDTRHAGMLQPFLDHQTSPVLRPGCTLMLMLDCLRNASVV